MESVTAQASPSLRVGSLFSGIGGFDLGFERAGMHVVWQCEQEEFCRAVLATRFPGVPCYPDICELEGGGVGDVDVLCGGFPCQDLSSAGKGAGIDGARSGLWAEYARLVGEIRPRYVVVENVAALLARGMGRVLGDLAALGYDAEWGCIRASDFGAPHRRDRLWIVAYPDGEHGEGREPVGSPAPIARRAGDAHSEGGRQVVADTNRSRRHRRSRALGQADGRRQSEDCGVVDGDVPDAAREQHKGASHAVGRSPGEELWGQWLAELDVGRVAHGIPARVDRLRSLGNALVPQIAEWIGQRIVEYEHKVR